MEMIQDDAPPTELAVNWVMRVADSGGNGKLDVNDCEKAIKLYAHYLRTKDQVDRIFATYDADGDDALSRDEMKRYLAAELNNGVDPTNEELDWIIAKCDVGGMTSVPGDGYIGRTEILAVSGEWTFRPTSVRADDGPVLRVSDDEEEEEESKPPVARARCNESYTCGRTGVVRRVIIHRALGLLRDSSLSPLASVARARRARPARSSVASSRISTCRAWSP